MGVAQDAPVMEAPAPAYTSGADEAIENKDAELAKEAVTANGAVANLLDPADKRQLHVLLVEDDHATLVFVKALLKSCGHKGASRTATGATYGFYRTIFLGASCEPWANKSEN